MVLALNEWANVDADGAERQIIKDVDGNAPRAKIRACSVCDPYVLIVREDDTLGMFVATDTKKIRRKDVTPMGDKVDLNSFVGASWD
jgi:cleavage and polyadenylation specificity factor subunit 1